MPKEYFKFKQFTVYQQKSAMKVCTDSCVLGAFANHNSPGSILDIGAGTGLLSLMLAQRFPKAEIDAVEIDVPAAQEASENIKSSPFSNRIKVYNSDIRTFKKSNYDLIVCNPPFFSNSLKSTNNEFNLATHISDLTPEVLVEVISEFISDTGSAFLMYPVFESEILMKKAGQAGLYIKEILNLYKNPKRKDFRRIIVLSKAQGEFFSREILIKDESDRYTPNFTQLLKDYYTIF
jgi:tRNA1Val (adenine37-N6)-methyltransferase